MKTLLIALAALVVLGGGYYWYTQQTPSESAEVEEEMTVEDIESQDSQSKLDINVVCESALAYMTFTDGESAAQFVAECKAGEHPEVIERYKADMGYGEGAAI